MATVKKVKKAQDGLRAKADNTSVKKPVTSKVPGTNYKYLDNWTASGKTPSSQDSAEYRKGYSIGVRGRKPGIFEPLRTHIGAQEGLENSKKYEKKKSGGKVMMKRADGSVSQRGLWDNLRNKAAQNKKTGAKPKAPTKAMLSQEKKIKAKAKAGIKIYIGDQINNLKQSKKKK